MAQSPDGAQLCVQRGFERAGNVDDDPLVRRVVGTALAATRLGVRDYLVKPFNIRDIKERVEEALKPRTPSDHVRRQQGYLHNPLFTPGGSRLRE